MTFLIVLGLLIMCETPQEKYHIKFENDPELKIITDSYYELESEMLAWVNDCLIVVPKGFRTDLASVPWWMQWRFNSKDRSLIRPGILHDYFYDQPGSYSRKEVDEIFYYALQVEGNSLYTRYAMYTAVRLFGWRYYAK